MELEYVNTPVVRALMSLRGIDQNTLCTLAHVASQDMDAWLSDDETGEERVEFTTQLEILRYLGIQGEAPRNDVVHFWRVDEPFFSRASTTYWPLEVVLKSFGKAQVTYLAREADPALTFKAVTRFALKFASFNAILEITTHPLRSPSFDPESMANLSWLPDTMGVLLPEKQYDALEPGSMKVKNLTHHLTYTAERAHWDRLRDLAFEKGIAADQVAAALLMTPGALHCATPAAQTPQVSVPVQAAPVEAAPVVEAVQRPAMETPQVRVTPAAQTLNEDLKLFARPTQKATLRAVV